MANKVDVFTEELSKVFTILQQQYVMIKYMKALITSGELDETEINKLKEQITLINTNIDTITNTKLDKITTSGENRVYGISSIGEQTNYAIGYYVNNLLAGYLARYNDSGRLSTPNPQSNNDCANKKYVDDSVASAGGKIYSHQLTLHTDDGEYQDLGLTVYSSSNLNVNSLEDLTTLLKPNSNTLYFAFVIHTSVITTYKVVYDDNIWKMGYDDESTGKPDYIITSVSDIVTPM